jgi:hypothetical protein
MKSNGDENEECYEIKSYSQLYASPKILNAVKNEYSVSKKTLIDNDIHTLKYTIVKTIQILKT